MFTFLWWVEKGLSLFVVFVLHDSNGSQGQGLDPKEQTSGKDCSGADMAKDIHEMILDGGATRTHAGLPEVVGVII
jgi:hypothetical protein